MKILISVVIGGALLLCSALPVFADAGVSIPLTVTVTGGGSGGGGGGGFNSGGSFPNSMPDWTKIFPSMNQRGSSAQVDNRPVAQNPPIYITPVIPQSTTDGAFNSQAIEYTDPNSDPFKIDWFLIVCLGAILLAGTIIVIILVNRRKY
jgi:hypothetical protein